MRKLMWFTLGFGAACLLCAYVLPGKALLALALACAAGAFLLGFAGKDRMQLAQAAMLLFGCGAGLFWYSQYSHFYLDSATALDGQTRRASFRASDYSYETAHGSAVDAALVIDGKSYQVRVYWKDSQTLEPGDTIAGAFRFRLTTPDASEGPTYHQGKGIFLLAYQAGEVAVSREIEHSLRDVPARLRRQIKDVLQRSFPEDARPFAKALLLGDTSDLTYETDTALKLSGIRHVAAVSGLHISILFALFSAVAFRKRFLSAALGFPVLALFAALAGFTPSVTRACIMSALMLLSSLLNREYDGATALSFAALMMLTRNPLVITGVGFQLSVGSVSGIYLFGSQLRSWLAARIPGNGRLRRWLVGSIAITLSAQVFTVPLCAWYFGTVSLIGILTNLLVLWLMPVLFGGTLAVALTGFFWQAGSTVLGWLLSWPIRYVLLVSKVLAKLPLAAVYTESPWIVIWLVFVYLMLLCFLLNGKRKPVILICGAVLGLCAALLASWGLPLLDNTRLTVLDVGQGQCLLLQSEGRTYMVDCGGDRDTQTADLAAATLLSQGITHLDGLILTHADQDHSNALSYLLSRVDTDLLILPPEAASFAVFTDGQVVYAQSDLVLTYGDTTISIFAPGFSGNSNENSLCVLFDTEKCDILITGDRSSLGEGWLLQRKTLPKVDILIAGHHGAKDSTSPELLQAVHPETVCISVGEDNLFGHPAPELLARLKDFGCTVHRTDREGTILIRR